MIASQLSYIETLQRNIPFKSQQTPNNCSRCPVNNQCHLCTFKKFFVIFYFFNHDYRRTLSYKISVYNTGKMENKNAGKWKVKCHSMGLPYLKTIRALRCKKSQQTKMFHVKGYLMLHQLFFNSLRKEKEAWNIVLCFMLYSRNCSKLSAMFIYMGSPIEFFYATKLYCWHKLDSFPLHRTQLVTFNGSYSSSQI